MSSAINQINLSTVVNGAIQFFSLDYFNQNMDLDTLFTHLSVPKNPETALSLVRGTMEKHDFAEICVRLMVTNTANKTTVIHGFEGGLEAFQEFCKTRMNNKIAILHLTEQGEWQFAAKNEELDTQGLVGLVEALKQLYMNQNIPDELVDILTQDEDHPLRIFEVEEYADDEQLVYRIEPLYSDCPAHIDYEDNYVTELEHEED